MTGSTQLAWSARRADDGDATPDRRPGLGYRQRPGAAQDIALWLFMGVATALFSLFLVAYLMRLSANDATAVAMPWQLWLSTTWLLVGSVALQRASRLSRQGQPAQRSLLAGGACALGFIASQSWAWAALLGAQVSLTGNPAGSFFYLLTVLHGLHVAGGVVAWSLVFRAQQQGPATAAWRIALCARYWHFLLLLWLGLFFAFSVITPDLAAAICGTR